MSATFLYTETETHESLLVSGTVTRTIASAHPNFLKVKNYLFDAKSEGKEIDFEYVLGLIDAGAKVVDTLIRITDRISYKNGVLSWDGEAVDNTLSNHIVRMLKSGDSNYLAFARFMEKLATNPSKKSRKALYDFITAKDFTITEDGDFLGYKGVNSQFLSHQSGYGIVNGVETTGQLDNTPGNTVEVPRNRVDDNRDSACSYGLHVGTRKFATSWSGSGGKMVIVAVNPRDVVMVPRDGNGAKMRVCKYVVIEENEKEIEETTYYYAGSHRHHQDEDGEDTFGNCEECGDCPLDGNGDCACCEDRAEPVFCDRCQDGEVDEEGDLCEYCEEAVEEERLEEEHLEAEQARRLIENGTCGYCGLALDDNGLCPDAN